jgi:hypothetical protein
MSEFDLEAWAHNRAQERALYDETDLAETLREGFTKGREVAEASLWTSVADQLPEHYGDIYLVRLGEVVKGHYNVRHRQFYVGDSTLMNVTDQVTHWYQFPKVPPTPPRAKEGE